MGTLENAPIITIKEGIKKIKRIKLFLIGIIVFFICSGIVLAEGTESKVANTLPLPDLVVNSVDFVPVAKEGGVINLVKIGVMNQGKADAGKCILGLSCTAIKCNEGNKCDEISRLISADIAVSPLKQGEKADLEWQPTSSIQWVSGKYSVVADIDKYNAVQESEETNNTSKSVIYIKSFSPR